MKVSVPVACCERAAVGSIEGVVPVVKGIKLGLSVGEADAATGPVSAGLFVVTPEPWDVKDGAMFSEGAAV